MINKKDNSEILKTYNLDEAHFLGKGQEADVYLYDHDNVLKIYNSRIKKEKLEILNHFYQSIDNSTVRFELPQIHKIIEEENTVVTIEKRIVGKNIQKQLSDYDDAKLDEFMRQYLSIVLELKNIKFKSAFEGYKLFKDYDLSHSKTNDWNDFLRNYLIEKQKEVKDFLSKDVVNYEYKYAKLIELLSNEYRGDYSLIHGDFYPANLLVKENGVINGVIDFGMMTMYGDYLFDVALSWTLFDLYDELGTKLDRYLNLIITKLGEEVRSKIYLYALYYAIYSANFYSKDCSDGHYGWSVRILNNEMYWNGLD